MASTATVPIDEQKIKHLKSFERHLRNLETPDALKIIIIIIMTKSIAISKISKCFERYCKSRRFRLKDQIDVLWCVIRGG